MRRFLVSEDQLYQLALDSAYTDCRDNGDVDALNAMVDCRKGEIPEGDFMMLDGEIISNPEGGESVPRETLEEP